MSRTDAARATSRPRALAGLAALALAAASASACRQDMYDQPKATPLVESDFFHDGKSARPPVPGTVARGQLREDRVLETGIGPDGKFVGRIPVSVDRALLLRGRERFDIFCAPCHDRTGSGQGMIVQRGYKRPPSFHEDRLRAQRIGYFFDVMTNGFGEMPAYASQIPIEDRWAIAAYLRALQLAQHAPLAGLTSEDRAAIDAAASRPAPPSSAHGEGGEGSDGGAHGSPEAGAAHGADGAPRTDAADAAGKAGE